MAAPAATGHLIDVGEGKLHVHVRDGDQPTVVFLHYWGGSHRTWTPVIDKLGPRIGSIAYDHRGWGESNTVPGPFGLDQLADDAQRVIDTLGTASYVLVGHSMGAKVVQLLAGRRPQGLSGAILVAPAPPRPAPVTAAQQDGLAHAYDTAESVIEAIDLMLTKRGLTPELQRQVIQDSLRGSAEARAAWPRHGLVADIRPAAEAIDVPVLVLAGEDDRVDPPAALATHLMPHIPGATMMVLPNTGHLSPLEIPNQIAGHIAHFVSQVQQ